MLEFKNINCEAVDKEFSEFEYCYLKSVNRTYKYISVKLKLLQLPVTNAKVWKNRMPFSKNSRLVT